MQIDFEFPRELPFGYDVMAGYGSAPAGATKRDKVKVGELTVEGAFGRNPSIQTIEQVVRDCHEYEGRVWKEWERTFGGSHNFFRLKYKDDVVELEDRFFQMAQHNLFSRVIHDLAEHYFDIGAGQSIQLVFLIGFEFGNQNSYSGGYGGYTWGDSGRYHGGISRPMTVGMTITAFVHIGPEPMHNRAITVTQAIDAHRANLRTRELIDLWWSNVVLREIRRYKRRIRNRTRKPIAATKRFYNAYKARIWQAVLLLSLAAIMLTVM